MTNEKLNKLSEELSQMRHELTYLKHELKNIENTGNNFVKSTRNYIDEDTEEGTPHIFYLLWYITVKTREHKDKIENFSHSFEEIIAIMEEIYTTVCKIILYSYKYEISVPEITMLANLKESATRWQRFMEKVLTPLIAQLETEVVTKKEEIKAEELKGA